MTGADRLHSVERMIKHHTPPPAAADDSTPAPKRRRLGVPFVAVVGLALLAVPRVILHDLGIIHEGSAINWLFVFLPPIAWIIVVLAVKVPNPFVTILVIGVCYGVFLALGHQLMWSAAFEGSPPQLGGNLSGLDPTAQDVIIRAFAIPSSVLTGAVVGAVTGLIAWGLSALTDRKPTVHRSVKDFHAE